MSKDKLNKKISKKEALKLAKKFLSLFMVKKKGEEKIKIFFDKQHSVMEDYYNLMEDYYNLPERDRSNNRIKEELERLIERDPFFFDPYLDLSDILFYEGEDEKATKLLEEAYQKAVKRITDKNGNWPKRIPWAWLENRHIVRAIHRWANELWGNGQREEALNILRKLLKTNPNDNIGARYDILAIRLGLDLDYEKQFELKDMPGFLDAREIAEWFEKYSKMFPEEFDWWWKEVLK